MSSLALSVLLSLVSAVAYAAGAIIQERVAATGDNSSRALVRNGVWWVAVVLNGAGAVLHVVALAYGPLSLVQPLGALTIVFALPMAALFVGRRAGATAWRGALMATAGLGGLLALTGDAEPHTLNGPEQVLLASVTFGAVGVLVVFARTLRRPVLRSVVLATGAGGAFGMASVFTKTVAVEWTSGSVRTGVLPLLAIAGLAAAGLFLSQAAYRGAGLTAPLATVTVVNPVVAAAIGITLFGEHFRLGAPGTALALCCGALAAAGLVLLTRERLDRERAEEAGAAYSGARSAGPVGAPDAVRGTEEADGGRPPASPSRTGVPTPAAGRRTGADRPSPLPPGQAGPGAPGPRPGRRRTGATLRPPVSERPVQTLTPPARR
ncbi:DMT family transporter [Streptomyces sp. RB110-1]|uniref:DMT family transporter n=1 Tax=unclassified Streptomyces TaxID=2593676 RepID=UPI0019011679|nr:MULTISPECIES: DMT family transporter [unclassified Streptomyces]MBK0373053.1 DMT family transporter [Streptomyces sp. RB110-1]MBK0390579.1 DMT family transporter [Streptomyces sp. RB110-2]